MPAEERVQGEQSIIVVAAGEADQRHRDRLPAGARVVAADGGVDCAHALGLTVDVAVGDFDSITPEGLDAVAAAGGSVERHPAAKDATDLELALDAALALGAKRVLVIADPGGRLDHLVALLLLLGHERYEEVQVDALLGGAQAHVIRRDRSLDGEPGELISLLALHGAAAGVTTEGLAYPLRDERLEAGSSRGVSNTFTGRSARITVAAGVLLALRPAPESERSST